MNHTSSDQQTDTIDNDAHDGDEDVIVSPQNRRERLIGWVQLRRSLLIRLGVGITVVSAIALINPSFLGWGTAVTAAVLAVPVSRFRAYTLAFLPYGVAWLVFTLLRALADETPIGLRTAGVTAVERALFFGEIPTIWLQERMFDPSDLAWYDYATTFVHWSYFFVPHVAAILIWKRDPERYNRYLLAMTLTLGIGLVIYFLAPAAPPWLTADIGPEQDIYRVMSEVGRSLNSSLYERTYSVLGDPNPVAAMPSLHHAITFLLFLFALNYGKWIASAAFLYTMAMAFTLVYTGEHYVIDAIIGSAITTYAYLVAGRWLRITVPVFHTVARRTIVTRADADG